jgi:hypothetical protein
MAVQIVQKVQAVQKVPCIREVFDCVARCLGQWVVIPNGGEGSKISPCGRNDKEAEDRKTFRYCDTVSRGKEIGSSSPPLRERTKEGVPFFSCLNPRVGTRSPETYSIPFCVHQETMELMRQVAPTLCRQDSKYSWIFGSSSSYSICVPPSLTLTSIGLSSPSATKL